MESLTDMKKLQSTKCQESFRWGSCAVKHMRDQSGETPFHHSEYSKIVKQKSLAELVKIHKGINPFLCSECGKSYSRKVSLVQHMRIHTGETPHHCSECSKSFAQRSNLVEHMRVHTGEKPYHCSVCHKAFRQKSNLVTHMNVHTQKKSFQCSECEKFFSVKGSLVQHVKIHMGEKFQCSECDKSFSRKGNLIKHMSNHTGEKFCCSECNKSFHWRMSLVRHMKIHVASSMKNQTEENSLKDLEVEEGQLIENKPTFWNVTVEPLTRDENSQRIDTTNCHALISSCSSEDVQSPGCELNLSQPVGGEYMTGSSEVIINHFGKEVKKEDEDGSDSTIWKLEDPLKFEKNPRPTIKVEITEDCIFVKEEL